MKKIVISRSIFYGSCVGMLALLWASIDLWPPGINDAPAAPVEVRALVTPKALKTEVVHSSNPFEVQLAKQKQANSTVLPAATAISGAENPVPLGRDPFSDFLQQQRDAHTSPFTEPVAKP